jgi:hypothetical protein
MNSASRAVAYIVLAVVAVVLLWAAIGWIECLMGKRRHFEEEHNRFVLSQLRRAVCLYTEEYECLPSNMASLLRDSRGVRWIERALDARGGGLLYRLDKTCVSAEIWCLGRDGLPGGNGANADSGYLLRRVPGSPGKLTVVPLT